MSSLENQNYYYEEGEEEQEEEEEEMRWIEVFLNKEENDWILRIPEDFIDDGFNLFGLEEKINNFDESISIIQGEYSDSDIEVNEEEVTQAYYAIHSRYIISPSGLEEMKELFENKKFGICPRLECQGQAVLPYGISDLFGQDRTYIYCPCCQDIYEPYNSSILNLDGSAFGSNFATLFISTFLDEININEFIISKRLVYGFPLSNEKNRNVRSIE